MLHILSKLIIKRMDTVDSKVRLESFYNSSSTKWTQILKVENKSVLKLINWTEFFENDTLKRNGEVRIVNCERDKMGELRIEEFEINITRNIKFKKLTSI